MKLFGDDKQVIFSDFRLPRQQSLKHRKIDLETINAESLKVVIQRREIRTPSSTTAKRIFGYKRTPTKSPTEIAAKMPENVKFINLSPVFTNRRKFSNHFIDRSVSDFKTKLVTRNFRSGQIKLDNSKRKSLQPHLLRACIFDTTVPDAIIIYSNSPPRITKEGHY